MRAQVVWIVVGLGNPDKKYSHTRHNVGKDFVSDMRESASWRAPKNIKVAELNVYMNNSGGAIRKLIPSKKAAEKLIIMHDDLDLPLGKIKISFGSGAGGHNGVKSVERALKTQEFVRVRIGISPTTPSGKVKRPDPKKIVDFVLSPFRPAELEKLKKSKKQVSEALKLIATKGVERAQTEINKK